MAAASCLCDQRSTTILVRVQPILLDVLPPPPSHWRIGESCLDLILLLYADKIVDKMGPKALFAAPPVSCHGKTYPSCVSNFRWCSGLRLQWPRPEPHSAYSEYIHRSSYCCHAPPAETAWARPEDVAMSRVYRECTFFWEELSTRATLYLHCWVLTVRTYMRTGKLLFSPLQPPLTQQLFCFPHYMLVFTPRNFRQQTEEDKLWR